MVSRAVGINHSECETQKVPPTMVANTLEVKGISGDDPVHSPWSQIVDNGKALTEVLPDEMSLWERVYCRLYVHD
jgi:hypothetical protein